MQKSAVATEGNVLYALVLRDMQTRFGGSYVNYVIAFAWPLGHIALLLVIYSVTGRASPVGDDMILFFATGLTPYMFFQYPARFMMISVQQNKPLLAFPIVKLMDVMLARAMLESITGFGVICVTAFVLYALGHEIVPRDPVSALGALSAMWCLAIGFGLLNAVIAAAFQPWVLLYVVIQISLYLTSGIVFVASTMPERVQKILAWNPALHGVEWFRSAYYVGYGSEYMPDKVYPFVFGLICLFVALVAERFLVNRFMKR